MKTTAFWDIALSNLKEVGQHFCGVQCLYFYYYSKLHGTISHKAFIFNVLYAVGMLSLSQL
jgi:hypothetical protein